MGGQVDERAAALLCLVGKDSPCGDTTAAHCVSLGEVDVTKRRGFAITAAIFAAVATVLFFTVFANCRDRFEEHAVRTKGSLGRSLRNLAHNGPWAATFIFAALILVRLGALIATTIYFAIDVLHKPWLISILLPIISLSYGIAAAFAPAFFKRFGIRRGNIVALLVGAGIFALLPLFEGKIWIFVAIYTASSLAVGLCPTSAFAMTADAVDYQQWKFGTRDDGLLFSSISLSTKVGMAAGASFVAYVLAWAHFNPVQIKLPVAQTIRHLYYWLPPVLMLVQIIPMMFYGLDKLHPQIVRELASRSEMEIGPTALSAEEPGI